MKKTKVQKAIDIESVSSVPGFFVFEGIDGAGKTSLIQEVHTLIKARHKRKLKVLKTKEPDGVVGFEFGMAVRKLVTGNHATNPYTQALLMFAARYENCIHHIVPHLIDNYLVLCDRWMDSSYAYQGIGGGVDFDFLKTLNSRFPNIARTLNKKNPGDGDLFSSHIGRLTYPDKIFLLDIDPKIAAERLKSSRENLDGLEQEYLNQMQRIRYHYHGRVANFPDQYHVLDVTRDIQDLAEEVYVNILDYVHRVNSDMIKEEIRESSGL